MHVLITDVSSYKAIVISKFLKQVYKNIRIVSCDYRSLTKYVHTKHSDKHYVLNNQLNNPEAYCLEIAEIVKDERIDVVLPVNSSEMNIVLRQREIFAGAMDYWGSTESFELLNTKSALYEYCDTNNIDHPNCFPDLNEVSFPLVVKPSVSSSSKGVYYCNNDNEYQNVLKHVNKNNLVVQRFVSGVGVGYSLFAVDGEIVTAYGHRRLAEYPVSGGSSMYRCQFRHEKMERIAENIIQNTNWSGFAMFEFKLTNDDDICLIEVNPRIWGSINQGLANGTNYFQSLIDAELKTPTRNPERCTYFSPYIYLSLLFYTLKGNVKPLFNFIGNLFNNEADISFFRDPRGWISTFARLV